MSSIKIIENYHEQSAYRNLFFDFTPKALYGADFKQWYLQGKWNENYHVVSMIEANQLVANVSYSTMKIWVRGEIIKAVQLATVGTLPTHRNKGYAKLLMNLVLDKVEKEYPLVFLFANDTVMGFYPKFGFKRKKESLFRTNGNAFKPSYGARKINIHNILDNQLLSKYISKRHALTQRFGAENYDHILWWHVIYDYHDHIYFIRQLEIIVIYEIIDNTLHLYEIIQWKRFSFEVLVPKLISKPINSIIFYFTPELIDVSFEHGDEYLESPLFVKGELSLMDYEFKFPVLAQT